MKRLQLVEIHDQSWCPPSLRDGLTRCLNFAIYGLRPYRSVADLLVQPLSSCLENNVVDLCSGSGGPWPYMVRRLQKRLHRAGYEPVSVTLTDKFPPDRVGQLPQKVSYLPESIDATSVDPTVVCGFRTLFTSFHHFEPDMATELLSDAVRSGEGIAVFEFTRRHPVALLSFFLAPWLIPFSLPFHGRRGWRDWLWTFPIPILPLVVLFDGLVSCLRTYSPEQCLELASVADPDGRFDWEAGVKFSLPAGMTYLVGTPRRTEAEPAVTS